jgi:MoxR-like ATPase
VAHTQTLPDKFASLEGALNIDVLERGREIHCASNALVSRRHFFMLGPPGTAKSYLVRRLVHRIDFGEDPNHYFQWLLTKYTTPEEIFGPPLLTELKKGNYIRNTNRKLPLALVALLDEIFKANSSILNALLTIMNERLFFNGADDAEVPLSSIFGMSNEMPADEGLHALWDRLHFRFEVKPVQDGGNFVAMLSTIRDPHPEPILTWDDVVQAQQEAAKVVLGPDIFESLKLLRDNLAKEGIEPTERRFMESLAIIRAEAFLNGRTHAEIDDLRVLRHVLWSRTEDQRVVERTVLELANPIDKEAHDLLERVEGLRNDLLKAVKEADNPRAVAKQAVEIHGKLHKAKQKMDDLQKRVNESGRKSDILEGLEKMFVDVAKLLMTQGFGMDPPGA